MLEQVPDIVQQKSVPVARPLPRAVRIEISPEPIVDEPEIISLTGTIKTYLRVMGDFLSW